MPYCDECGNEVSITDKRCSKCGSELNPIPKVDFVTKIKNFLSPEKYHNIEFILALIAVVLSVLAIPSSFNSYSYTYSDLLILILVALFVAVLGAIIIRYHARTGAIIILIAGFALVLFGMQSMFLPLIFYIFAAILAFIR